MGSVYIHIPFCKKACRYCDFYFTVSTRFQDEYTDVLILELRRNAEIYSGLEMKSLYLGGGTPSLLSRKNLDRILEEVMRLYHFLPNAEVTVECNPDDMDRSFCSWLRNKGANRLSIGIQSFRDKDLELLRRSHTSQQASNAVDHAHGAGFENINIDLIYGIPGQGTEDWEKNLEQANNLPVKHLSAYLLSFEPGTVFHHWRKLGRLSLVSEETIEQMFRVLRQRMLTGGFEHYEVSNFAKNKMRSIHNQGYWTGEHYLGFGPSAHSFNGTARSWNVSSLKQYMEAIRENREPKESERLTDKEMYHDLLITALRTDRGIDKEVIKDRFGPEIMAHFIKKAGPIFRSGDLLDLNGRVIIDPAHWLIADRIIRELFLD